MTCVASDTILPVEARVRLHDLQWSSGTPSDTHFQNGSDFWAPEVRKREHDEGGARWMLGHLATTGHCHR